MLFESELTKLGLKDKEAAVYLACLQLGPSAVQPIARKAKVVRATTYVVLESLMKDGLVTKFKEGKKTLFSAEPPMQLTRLLDKEQDVVKEKRDELEKLLPELQVLMRGAGDRPSVRYFAGLEGLKAMRQEMVMYTAPGDIWYSFTPLDHLIAVFGRNDVVYQQRLAKGIRSKTIFSTKSETLKKQFLDEPADQLTERRFVSPVYFPSMSGMTIFKDRIAIGGFTGKLGGVIVESRGMADMMRRIFELAWRGAETIEDDKASNSRLSKRLDK